MRKKSFHIILHYDEESKQLTNMVDINRYLAEKLKVGAGECYLFVYKSIYEGEPVFAFKRVKYEFAATTQVGRVTYNPLRKCCSFENLIPSNQTITWEYNLPLNASSLLRVIARKNNEGKTDYVICRP